MGFPIFVCDCYYHQYQEAVSVLTVPWSSGFVWSFLHNDHWFLGAFALSNTISLISLAFLLTTSVFLGDCEQITYTIYTKIYLLNAALFPISVCNINLVFEKTPGGSITAVDVVVNRLFGDKGLNPGSSLIVSTVSGSELITPSVSALSVCKDCSFTLWPCICNKDASIPLAERILRSHIPSMWLAAGGFLFHFI